MDHLTIMSRNNGARISLKCLCFSRVNIEMLTFLPFDFNCSVNIEPLFKVLDVSKSKVPKQWEISNAT